MKYFTTQTFNKLRTKHNMIQPGIETGAISRQLVALAIAPYTSEKCATTTYFIILFFFNHKFKTSRGFSDLKKKYL